MDRYNRFTMCIEGGLFQYEFVKKKNKKINDFGETHQIIQSENLDFFEIIALENGMGSYYAVVKEKLEEDDDDLDEYLIYEVKIKRTEVSINKTGIEIYYQKGRENLKTTSSYLYFLKSYNTVTVVNNPHFETFFKIFDFEFDFPVHDFVMINSDKVLAVSKTGFISGKIQISDKERPSDAISFQMELKPNEQISLMKIEQEKEKYILIVTELEGMAHRIFGYQIESCGNALVIFNVFEHHFGNKMMKSICKVDMSLKENGHFMKRDRIFLFIESGKNAGVLVMTLDEDDWAFSQKQHIENYFIDGFVGMCVNDNTQYWLLDHNYLRFVNKRYMLTGKVGINSDDEKEDNEDEKEDNEGEKEDNEDENDKANDGFDDDDDEIYGAYQYHVLDRLGSENTRRRMDDIRGKRGRNRLSRRTRGNYDYFGGVGLSRGHGDYLRNASSSSDDEEKVERERQRKQAEIQKILDEKKRREHLSKISDSKKVVEEREKLKAQLDKEREDEEDDSDDIANYVDDDDDESSSGSGEDEDEDENGEESDQSEPDEKNKKSENHEEKKDEENDPAPCEPV